MVEVRKASAMLGILPLFFTFAGFIAFTLFVLSLVPFVYPSLQVPLLSRILLESKERESLLIHRIQETSIVTPEEWKLISTEGYLGAVGAIVAIDAARTSEEESLIQEALTVAIDRRPFDGSTLLMAASVALRLNRIEQATELYKRYFASASSPDSNEIKRLLRQRPIEISKVLPPTLKQLASWYKLGASRALLEDATLAAIDRAGTVDPTIAIEILESSPTDAVRKRLDELLGTKHPQSYFGRRSRLTALPAATGINPRDIPVERAQLYHWNSLRPFMCGPTTCAIGAYRSGRNPISLIEIPCRISAGRWGLLVSDDNVTWYPWTAHEITDRPRSLKAGLSIAPQPPLTAAFIKVSITGPLPQCTEASVHSLMRIFG